MHTDDARLAWYLSAPSLALDWHPGPPWGTAAPTGWPALNPPETGGGAGPGSDSLAETFLAVVAAQVAGHDRVALLYTGELASAALLAVTSRLCRDRGAELLVLVADGPDADGVSQAALVQPSLAGLARGDTTLTLEPQRWFRPEPAERNPEAPALWYPRFTARAVTLAREWGATVCLSPAGGDGLLSAPWFLAGHLRGGHARQYLRDSWRAAGAAGPLTQLLSRLGPLGRRPTVATARLMASRLASAARQPPAVLSADAMAAARNGTREWLRAATTAFTAASAAAAEAGLVRGAALSERAAVSPDEDGGLPPRMPYLDPLMVAAAAGIPLADRYDGRQPTAYLRHRALMTGLVPEPLRRFLPVEPPGADLDDAYAPEPPVRRFPRCADRGLLPAPDVPDGTSTVVLRRLQTVESWLIGVAP